MENERKVIQFSYSEIGKRHEELNLGNQDTVFVGKVCNDAYCLAVADGVSSCKWAKKGSRSNASGTFFQPIDLTDRRRPCSSAPASG